MHCTGACHLFENKRFSAGFLKNNSTRQNGFATFHALLQGHSHALQHIEMERFRIEVGKKHGVKPGDIVGAIANEAGLDSDYIGEINMRGEFSTVDLPAGMPKELFHQMKSIPVRANQIRITRYGKETPEQAKSLKQKTKSKGKPNKSAGRGKAGAGNKAGSGNKARPGNKNRATNSNKGGPAKPRRSKKVD